MRKGGPERLLYAVVLVIALGTGMFTVGSTLFFVQVLGFSPVRMGLGLTIAAVLGLLVSVPLTRLVNGRSLRTAYLQLLLVQAVSLFLLPQTRSFGLFIAIMTVNAIGAKTARAVNNALIGHMAGPRRLEVRAVARSLNNFGTAAGALLSSAAVADDGDRAYELLILANACTLLLAAALVLGLRSIGRMSRSATPSGSALRDTRYRTVTLIDAVMCLEYFVITLVLPLWVVGHTNAPKVVIPFLFVLNMIMVALLQLPISRRVRDVAKAARCLRISGVVFFGSLALLAAAASAGPVLAVGLLFLGVAVHTVGEIFHAAGASELSYGLAPPDRLTEYQGVFGLGMGTAEVLAPYALAVVCLQDGRLGWLGWLGLGLVLTCAGWVSPLVLRTRSLHPPLLVNEEK
ncbi:MFS transporter [Sphaerisporangium siamense]|uniref:MFS transporter n=1 Tax=Sphaerisporangium siamense TaxID=795645 RepID=A0A7W7DBA7_9ACTN|nr:MFS transporter [Sphaerisporangium siamense]MBB4702845.1 hypothetical protein [Sphaerisporangium siamense]GII83398.1 MFS transporter [Sphaerisporangium siamense]